MTPTLTEVRLCTAARAEDDALVLVFPSGEVRISWQLCSPLLANASPAERADFELSPAGYGLHWPRLDEDLSVGGLLRATARASPAQPDAA